MSRLPTSAYQYATQNNSNKTATKQPQISHKQDVIRDRFKKPEERMCPISSKMEDEYHFLNICPSWQEKDVRY